MRQSGFSPGQGYDVIGRITQGAQRFAFGELDRIVEFAGLGHRGGLLRDYD